MEMISDNFLLPVDWVQCRRFSTLLAYSRVALTVTDRESGGGTFTHHFLMMIKAVIAIAVHSMLLRSVIHRQPWTKLTYLSRIPYNINKPHALMYMGFPLMLRAILIGYGTMKNPGRAELKRMPGEGLAKTTRFTSVFELRPWPKTQKGALPLSPEKRLQRRRASDSLGSPRGGYHG